MLTQGSLSRIIDEGDKQITPIVQVVFVKPLTVTGQHGVVRFRLTLWDGVREVLAMLATSKNEAVVSNQIQAGTLLKPTGKF